MSDLQVRCPGCQAALKTKSTGALRLRITCPHCQTQFECNVRPRQEDIPVAATAFPAPVPQRTRASQPQPVPNYPAAARQDVPRHAAPQRSKNSRSSSRWLLPLSLAGVGILVVAGVVGGVLWLRTQSGGIAGPVNNALSGIVPGMDSRDAVLKDLLAESDRVATVAQPLLDQPETAEIAQQLDNERKTFEKLAYRAASLPLTTYTVEDIRADLEKQQSAIVQFKANPQADNPTVRFWYQNSDAKSGEHPVQESLQQLRAQRMVAIYLHGLAADLPDPLADPPFDPQWSAEDRQRLHVYHLSGRFRRDFARALALLTPQSNGDAECDTLRAVIDRYADEARAFAATERIGGAAAMMIKVPRQTVYEIFDSQGEFAIQAVKAMTISESPEVEALRFVIDDAREVSGAINELMFRHEFAIEATSRERYLRVLDERAREAEEIARADEEVKRKEEERLRKESALVEQRKQEAEDQRKKLEEMRESDRNAGIGPEVRPFGPRGSGRPPGFGPGQGGFPPQAPGGGNGGPQRQPPAADPATDVTITIDQVTYLSAAKLRELAAPALRSHNYSASQSNKQMRITVHGYNRPLETLTELFPFLEFVSIDSAKRTVKAQEKPR